MTGPLRDVDAALSALRDRWGAAAPRRGEDAFGAVVGSLATVPLPDERMDDAPDVAASPAALPVPGPAGVPRRGPAAGTPVPVVPTGFAELDALLGPGGIPRTGTVALRGEASSGRTTLALQFLAEAQAAGALVAWLDLDRSFDPVEAVARGVRLEWLTVLVPATLDEGLALAGALLQARTVDLLLVDLPPRLERSRRVLDRLGRLTALARRAGAMLIVLEPPGWGTDAFGAWAGLRLELVRRAWIRLGRDVVGQRTEVAVTRNHLGPPGGRAEVRILYADGGSRDACLRCGPLLDEGPPGSSVCPVLDPPSTARSSDRSDAPSSSLLAPSAPPARPGPAVRRPSLHILPDRPADPRRASVGRRDGARSRSAGSDARRPPGDGARGSPSGRSRGDIPRPFARG